jgi:hypothetical protein
MTAFRLPVLVSLSLSFLVLTPSVAEAREARCPHRLLQDWYRHGRIQGQYRVSCYRAALADLPNDEVIYGTTRRDVSGALSSGIERVKREGMTVGSQTLLPAPKTFVPAKAALTRTHSLRSLVGLAFLLCLFLVWCIARWRSVASRR